MGVFEELVTQGGTQMKPEQIKKLKDALVESGAHEGTIKQGWVQALSWVLNEPKDAKFIIQFVEIMEPEDDEGESLTTIKWAKDDQGGTTNHKSQARVFSVADALKYCQRYTLATMKPLKPWTPLEEPYENT